MKPMFSKIKSRTRHYHYLCLPFLFICCYLLISTMVEAYFRANGAIYFSLSNPTIANTLSGALILVNLFLFSTYYNRTIGENDERDNISLQSNLIAKKITGKFFIVSTVIFMISLPLFYFSMFSRYEADSESFKKYNLISEDVTIFTYDEVTQIEVYLQREKRDRHNNGYATNIELETKNGTYTLSSSGFDDDYSLIKQFLSYFNEDIIMVDNTHADETEDNKFYGYIDHPEIFEEIYIN